MSDTNSTSDEKFVEEQIGKRSKLLSNSSLIEQSFSVKHSATTIPTQETEKKIMANCNEHYNCTTNLHMQVVVVRRV
jgi:hypothetical protein